MRKLVLGSQSPRRRQLLSQAGFVFSAKPANTDETISNSITPEEAVLTLSKRKSNSVPIQTTDVLLTADTVVAFEGRILGKPSDSQEAFDTLQQLSGNSHEVFTGVTIKSKEMETSFAVRTEVTFFSLEEREITDYIQKGECWDKAGGYGIQGKGALFVETIQGDYYNVVGLPISRVTRELRAFDLFPDS